MQIDELNQRILDLLAEERASHGHGSAADIDHRVGRSEGYLGRVLRGEVGLQVNMLLRILEALELEPSTFLAAAVGWKFEPEPGLRRIARRLANSDEEPAIQVDEAFFQRLEGLTPVCNSGGSIEKVVETWPRQPLMALDELRFSDPAATLRLMADMLSEVLERLEASPEDAALGRNLATALGVAASIERVSGRLEHAAQYLLAALRWVEDRTSVAYAEVLKRACYLMGDEEDFTTALQLAGQASQIYLREGDLHGVGGCLVDRAVMQLRAHQAHESIRWFKTALQFLPDWDWRNQFVAWQGLGMGYLGLARVEEAEKVALAASGVHATRSGLNWWRLIWLRAEIALRLGDLATAEHLFQQAKDGFDSAGQAADVAILTLRLARVLLSAEKKEETQHVAGSSIALLRTLRRYPLACRILEEFARSTLSGELTVQWLDQASQRLESVLPKSLVSSLRI